MRVRFLIRRYLSRGGSGGGGGARGAPFGPVGPTGPNGVGVYEFRAGYLRVTNGQDVYEFPSVLPSSFAHW